MRVLHVIRSIDPLIGGPTQAVENMARVLKPGGLMFLIAPWQWRVHPHPIDCWRILPDGMETIIRDAGLLPIECDINGRDCYAAASKP